MGPCTATQGFTNDHDQQAKQQAAMQARLPRSPAKPGFPSTIAASPPGPASCLAPGDYDIALGGLVALSLAHKATNPPGRLRRWMWARSRGRLAATRMARARQQLGRT